MRFKKIILFVVLVCAVILVRFTPLAHYFTLENLQAQKVYFENTVSNNPIISPLLFILLYFVLTALSIPGAAVLTIAGGFLFGVLPAVLYVNFGATAGAVGVFLIIRYFFGDLVAAKYSSDVETASILHRFNREISIHGHSYLLVLRLIPIFPFFLVNIFASLTTMTLKTYFWTTAIGIIPGTFLYAFAGRQLHNIKAVSDILSWEMLLLFIGLALFAISPVLLKKFSRGRSSRVPT